MNLPEGQDNILFTGGRSPYTLDLIRLFSKAGYKVYIAESFKDNMAGASKFTEENIFVPSPATETDKYINSLIEIIKKNNIKVLIPTCEEVYYISRNKEKLDKYCFVFTSSLDVLTTLHSKFKFMELLKELNILHPKSLLIDSLEELNKQLANRDTFVLKPEFSRFASYVIINDKSPEKINSLKISKENTWVLQDYLKGNAYCSYSVVQNGKVLAHSIYPSIYCAGQGATVHFESVNIPEIDEIVAKVSQRLNYTGHIAFDFFRSEEDGKVYPIECNPRATSGIYLFSEKDNLPLAFIPDKKLNNIIRATNQTQKMIFLAMILYCMPKLRSFKEARTFFKKLFASKDVIFKLSDIWPFIAQFKTLYHYGIVSKKEKISIIEVSTRDIEWNGN